MPLRVSLKEAAKIARAIFDEMQAREETSRQCEADYWQSLFEPDPPTLPYEGLFIED